MIDFSASAADYLATRRAMGYKLAYQGQLLGQFAAYLDAVGDEIPFRTPGFPLVPGAFVAVALYVVVSSIGSNPRNAAVGAALIAAGVPVFLLWRRRGAAPAPHSNG